MNEVDGTSAPSSRNREVVAYLGQPPYAAFEIVVLAASMGGLKAYRQILPQLPADFPAAVILVQHRQPAHQDLLPDILRREAKMVVQVAAEGDALEPGVIHVAAAGRQLLVTPEKTLTYGRASDQARRCAADPLLTSAAGAFGQRTLAVILSGTLDDGANGVRAVKQARGRVLAQAPASCEAQDMPRAAISTGLVDFVLPADKIGAALVALVMVPGTAEFFKVPIPYWAQLGRDVFAAPRSAFATASQGMLLARHG